MLKDITLGQYYEADSYIHKLDPRVKLVGTMVYIISIFAFEKNSTFAIVTLFLLLIIALSKIPLKFMLKGMKGILFILFFTAVFNLLLTPGEPFIKYGIIQISRPGIKLAVIIVIRLSYLVIGSSIMTLTTTPNQLTDGIESLLKPLKVFKISVHEIAMMMSIALRFIPILTEEMDKIMKAQKARGADFENGNVVVRAKKMIPILVPLFVAAFRRADELAMAMEARGYRGGEGRTKMKPLAYKGADYFAYFVLLVYLMSVFVFAFR